MIATPIAPTTEQGTILQPAGGYPLADVMAIDPRAVRAGGLFAPEDRPKGFALAGSVAVVSIEGALLQRALWCWDGYDAIASRFAAAVGDNRVGCVLLNINSPGGYLAGLFECCRLMRKAKEASRKTVIARADESIYSAAYALASVADEIYVPETGGVGSIGVITTLYDIAEANKQAGINVRLVYGGARKADYHPDAPLTEEAIERAQKRVDELHKSFARHVAEARGLSVDAVLGQEAGCFYGSEAVRAGLANGVKGLPEVLKLAESAARKTMQTMPGAKGAAGQEKRMSTIALLLGLAADASEQDIAARVSALQGTERELLNRTGKPSAKEALGAVDQAIGFEKACTGLTGQDTLAGARGVIEGWKAGAAKAEEHAAALKKVEAERTKTRVEGAIQKAKEEGRTTEAELATLRPQLEANPDWGCGYLASKPRVVPGFQAAEEEQEVTGASDQPAATKPYEALTNMERDALKRKDPKAFKRLRDDWEERGCPHTPAAS